jgi:outer membrane protein, heavy metal efflux system
VDVPQAVEARVATVASTPVPAEVAPCAAPAALPPGPFRLPALWDLALAYNPVLREAAAEVEAARGQVIQAGTYPNPRLAYGMESLGNHQDPSGTITVQIGQEIVTAGKRRLDLAIARAGTDIACLALFTRKFEVLTRVRRAYYDYLGWQYTVRVNEEVVATLRQSVTATRRLVEEVRSRPRTDLVRLEALLAEAQINQSRNRAFLEAAWRQLAAEVGLPGLPPPAEQADLPAEPRWWKQDAVLQRVLARHSELQQAAREAERARLEVERARAEAVPNVTVGGGYSNEAVDRVQGAIVNIETALPVWDRKQGRRYEAEARWLRAQAAQRTAAARLSRDVAEAFGRYGAAREQVERLSREVLPRLVESLELVRKGYQAGSADFTFADVLLAQEALNDARLRQADARRTLWLAVADLDGLMQLDISEEADPAACDSTPGASEPTPTAPRS